MIARLALLALALAAPAAESAQPVSAPAGQQARAALRTKQFGEAIRLLLQDATSGAADAQYLMGLAAANGVGVEQSRSEAVRWLQLAAEQSHVKAAYALAGVLANGDANDRARAQDWLQRASLAGHPTARELVAKQMLPLQAVAGSDGASGMARELLIVAIRKKDELAIAQLAPRAASARDAFGRTPLAYAMERGNEGAVAALLAAGANVDEADVSGISPLMLAAQAEDPASLELAIGRSTALDARDASGNAAVDYAARAGRATNVARLLTAGATRSVVGPAQVGERPSPPEDQLDPARTGELYRGWPPIAVAVSRNDTDLANSLRRNGASLDAHLPNGESLLHVAVKARATDVIPLLVAGGVNTDAPDANGRSALSYAAAHGFDEVVESLLSQGVSPDSHAPLEEVPLVMAARAGSVTVVRRLVAAQVSHDSLENAFWSALVLPRVDVLDVLLVAGAPVNAKRHGVSPIHIAASMGNDDVARALIAHEAAVDARTSTGQTPLILASVEGNVKVVARLLAAGAEPNSTNDAGDTALIAAARAGHLDVCRKLLAARADSRRRNSDRLSAADVAERRGYVDIVRLIETRT